jgi:multiple sugar transport system substrate-binding protein
MNKRKCMVLMMVFSMVMMLLSGCGGASNTSSNGDKVSLTFQIWDVFQQPGMEDLVEAYVKDHPNVSIEVQTINWDEYWTKLEASASSNSLPDIFWMHTNEFMKYATSGMLADLSDLYGDKNYYTNNFPAGLVDNASYNGKVYGVPKDWDTIALAYNTDLFDQAGVSYPDDTWTWDTAIEAAQTIYDKTGVSGFLAPLDDQSGYLNLVKQAGGYILNDDKTASGFTNEATKLGISSWISLQMDHDFSPKQATFAETDAGSLFVAGQGAMLLLGSWNVAPYLQDYPDLKWDVAVLPRMSNPVSGDGRGTIYNGLCYATSAKNKNLDVVKDFLKFLGTEEANIIQGKSGAAIPAYNGTSKYWVENLQDKLNVQVFEDMMEYGTQFYNAKSKSQWNAIVRDTLLEVYNGTKDLDTALSELQKTVDGYLAEE